MSSNTVKPTKWKLSATRKVTSTSTSAITSIFNPRKPLNMIGVSSNANKAKKQKMPKKSASSFTIKSSVSPDTVTSSGYSSSMSSNDLASKQKKKQKMVKSKSESEVIGRYQKTLNLSSSFEECEEEVDEDFEPDLRCCGPRDANCVQGMFPELDANCQHKQKCDAKSNKRDAKKKNKTDATKDAENIDDAKLEEMKQKWSKDVAKAKRSKYSSASTSLREFKSSASIKLSSVKNSIDYLIAQKLRLTSPKSNGLKNPMYQYGGLENEPPTPVKMYSPFSIESPSASNGSVCIDADKESETPMKKTKKLNKKKFGKKINPQIESRLILNPMAFASPTGKLHEDVASITNSMNELGMISQRIQLLSTSSAANDNFLRDAHRDANEHVSSSFASYGSYGSFD